MTYEERLAAQFYLLKAYLFYAEPLAEKLAKKEIPDELKEVEISAKTWVLCTEAKEYKQILNILQESNMKCNFLFEDTFNTIKSFENPIQVKNFTKELNLKTSSYSTF